MKKYRKGQKVKYTAIDNSTGTEFTTNGIIVGNAKDVRKKYPIEFGEVDDDCYLAKAVSSERLSVIHISDISK